MSDELTSDLRELAAAAETPPPVSGAEVRSRAVRRRRRRRTVVTVAGACAAAGLALVVVLNLGDGGTPDRLSPAASPTAPPSTPVAPDVTVNLARRVMTVAGRVLPISSGAARYPTAAGRMTVVGKADAKALPETELGLKQGEYMQKVSWVIEFRGSDGTGNFIAGLTTDEKAPGNYDATSGWIGLRQADAKWLYELVDPGAVIEIVGAQSTPPGAASQTPRATDGTDPAPTATDETGFLGGADAGAVPAPSAATAVPSG